MDWNQFTHFFQQHQIITKILIFLMFVIVGFLIVRILLRIIRFISSVVAYLYSMGSSLFPKVTGNHNMRFPPAQPIPFTAFVPI